MSEAELARELVGAHVEEWCPLPEGGSVKVQLGDDLGGGTSQATVWSEVVVPGPAEVVATFAEGTASGGPAILRTSIGSGTTWHAATALDRDFMRELVTAALATANVGPAVPGLPRGVEAVVRVGDNGTRFSILLNHGAEAARVAPPGPPPITLPPLGVAVLTDSDTAEGP